MSDDLRRGIGEVASGRRYQVAQRKLAQAAASYLDEGEKLVAPGAVGSRGGQILWLSGYGALVVAAIIIILSRGSLGAAGYVVLIACGVLAVLLVLLAARFTRSYAVILTDRRLLLFRASNVGQRLQGIFLAVPPGEVSAAFQDRWWWGGAVLSLEFSPATGQAPMQLHFDNVHRLGARYIHDALTTPASGADASPGPGKAA